MSFCLLNMEQKIKKKKKGWPNHARTLEPSLLSHFIAEWPWEKAALFILP